MQCYFHGMLAVDEVENLVVFSIMNVGIDKPVYTSSLVYTKETAMHSLGICNTLTGSAVITKLQTILVEFLKTPLYDLCCVIVLLLKS